MAPNEVVKALSEAQFSSSTIIGSMHILHYCWDQISEHEREIYIRKAKGAASELLSAIQNAERAMESAEVLHQAAE